MNDTLKNRIQEYRLQRAITQQELGDAVDVTRQTIIAIEKGNYIPSLSLGLALAKFFHVRVEDLFFF